MHPNIFVANITADDPLVRVARGKYVLSQFDPLGENYAFLVDGYVAGGSTITVARCNFPNTVPALPPCWTWCDHEPSDSARLHSFRPHQDFARRWCQRRPCGTTSFSEMEGDASDKNIAFMLLEDVADGPYYHHKWQGMPQTTPTVSGRMNALRLTAFFENLANPMSFFTAGGGAFGDKEGPKLGAVS